MKAWRVLFLITMVALPVAAGERIPVSVRVLDSPAQQLREGKRVANEAMRSSSREQRLQLTATAIETLEVVHKRWPSERNAGISAAALEADIFLATNAVGNAVDVLQRAINAAGRGSGVEGLYLRLGRAQIALQNYAAAETSLLAADKAASGHAGNAFAVNLALVEVYTRTSRASQAAQRLRALAKAPGLSATNAAGFYVRSAKAVAESGDRDSARRDLNEADAALRKAKISDHGPSELKSQDWLAHEIAAIRATHKL